MKISSDNPITVETLNLAADKLYDDLDETLQAMGQAAPNFDDPEAFILMTEDVEAKLREANQSFIQMHSLKKGLLV